MTLRSWNCRGLRQPRTVQELVCLVHTYKPKLVFLSETRRKNKFVSSLRWRLGLKHCIIQPGVGKGAGLALFYDESVEIIKLAVGLRYIDVLIRLNQHGPQWRGTFVYGEPKSHERHHIWNVLRIIKTVSNAPWFAIGDFNETLCQSEHFSATKRSEKNMANFCDTLSDCGLFDLGFKGPAWTYDNKQEGRKNVRARLDRGVASATWSDIFRKASVENICSSRSDHLPLLVRFGPRMEWRPTTEKRIPAFRYEYMWERVDSLSASIESSWKKNGRPETVGNEGFRFDLKGYCCDPKGKHHLMENQFNTHCAYKLDLAKAYDRVDWRYLEEVLGKIGFCQKWIKWTMECVTSVRFSVKCNGEHLEFFKPSRRLPQGDPLSPYLFLFVADGLVNLLKKEVNGGSITPIKIARNSLGISNLLFADDSMLFFKSTVEEVVAVKRVLMVFQHCTWQLLSSGKCSILFSEKCPEQVREEIKSVLEVKSVTFESKYLGLPTPEGRMKDENFQPIMDKLGKRCNIWNERFMSYAAKEVHVKSVHCPPLS
ncbi:uncharacterized protein [Aegilops tauschii subsp. strangulata]|uniref:uncharacterized protein n=1 Tax=Aegilops tauschii subsp. strangulata TaxID=200361 RepID=UPI003CC8DBFA